ncbi:MAG: hypothetical protein JWM69_767, partial [Candidatus Binatus sp.]|nr:hypothetical protein [Candidatus Binatus sp.]
MMPGGTDDRRPPIRRLWLSLARHRFFHDAILERRAFSRMLLVAFLYLGQHFFT